MLRSTHSRDSMFTKHFSAILIYNLNRQTFNTTFYAYCLYYKMVLFCLDNGYLRACFPRTNGIMLRGHDTGKIQGKMDRMPEQKIRTNCSYKQSKLANKDKQEHILHSVN